MRVTILDLGIGNLHSLGKAIAHAAPGAELRVETDPRACDRGSADLVVLPGSGRSPRPPSAPRGARHLRAELLAGLPCLGVCLGMQLLFDGSDEGPGEGLSVIPGRVTRLSTARAPHMGFSPVDVADAAPAWARAFGEGEGGEVAMYYAHSFACRPSDKGAVVATTALEGDTFPAIVERARTIGCQFHPEKSSSQGLALLGAIVRRVTSTEEPAA